MLNFSFLKIFLSFFHHSVFTVLKSAMLEKYSWQNGVDVWLYFRYSKTTLLECHSQRGNVMTGTQLQFKMFGNGVSGVRKIFHF